MKINREELLQEFANAIANIALDMIEDAADDALGDIDTMDIEAEEMDIEAEELHQPILSEEDEKAALCSDLASIVIAKLMIRLGKVDSWPELRKMYPRSVL